MKLENTIQLMFDKFPTLFQKREHCLQHLFLTNGNGYEWFNGELVYNYEEEYATKNIIKAEQHNIIDTYQKLYLQYKKEELEENIPVEKRRWDDATDFIKYADKPFDREYYDCEKNEIKHLLTVDNKWCKLSEIPDDIKPDWKLGVDETIEFFTQKIKEWGIVI